jgi:hypothetical protein
MTAWNINPAPSDALAAAARDKRQEAEQTRRLALGMSLHRDRQKLLWYAQDLEREAKDLERQAAQAGTTPAEWQHKQQLQQGPAVKDADPPEQPRKP